MKAYGRSEDRFEEELEEVLASMESDGALEVGAVIYEGDRVTYRSSEFFRGGVDHLIEHIQDQAWQEADEFSDGFADDLPKEKLAELGKLIEEWLDANVPVNFWTVRNIKPVEVTAEMIAERGA